MRKRRRCPRVAGRLKGECGTFKPAIIGAGLLALIVSATAPPARAADDSDNPSGWTKFMQFMGLKESNGPTISYSERAPLVVPPSRDLPPPVDDPGPSVADWPRDPAQSNTKKTAKPKAAVIPGTAVQTPNPAWQKKPWYDPTGWFNKEEYATFTGEPVRQSLTDPPAGYRIPSPEQPYGIPGSDSGKGRSQVNPVSAAGSAAPPPAASGAAVPAAAASPAASTPAASTAASTPAGSSAAPAAATGAVGPPVALPSAAAGH